MNISMSMKIPMALLIAALPLTVHAQTDAAAQQKGHTNTAVQKGQHSESNMRMAQDQIAMQRVSQQMNRDVYGPDDKKIGVIQDLVLDAENNRIAYAVLSFGGVMGVGDKYFAIPWSSIEHKPNQKDRVYLNTSEDQLKQAPGFDKNNWPDTASATYRHSIDSYYGVDDNTRSNWYTRHNVQRLDTTRPHTNVTEPRGADTDLNLNPHKDVNNDKRPTTDPKVRSTASSDRERVKSQAGPRDDGLIWSRRASAVVGTDVRNSKGQDIGEINDLVVDPRTGDVHYAILSFGGVMGMGDKLFAIPMDRIQTSSSEREFVIDVSKETLKNAKGFEDNQWPDWNDSQYKDNVEKVFKDQPRYGNTVTKHSMDDSRRDKPAVQTKDADDNDM